MFYGLKALIDIIDREGIDKITDEDKLSEIDSKMNELRRERQKFYDYRAAYTKVVRERSRQEEVNEILVDAISSGNLPSLDYEPTDIEADRPRLGFQ